MGIGVSLLLIAAGAVLTFAVHVSGHGFNVHTIGIILLVVGAIGALLSMIFWSSWAAPASAIKPRSSSAKPHGHRIALGAHFRERRPSFTQLSASARASRGSRRHGRLMLIWVLVLLLLILAIAGGLAISKFLFILLVLAVIVALVGARA